MTTAPPVMSLISTTPPVTAALLPSNSPDSSSWPSPLSVGRATTPPRSPAVLFVKLPLSSMRPALPYREKNTPPLASRSVAFWLAGVMLMLSLWARLPLKDPLNTVLLLLVTVEGRNTAPVVPTLLVKTPGKTIEPWWVSTATTPCAAVLPLYVPLRLMLPVGPTVVAHSTDPRAAALFAKLPLSIMLPPTSLCTYTAPPRPALAWFCANSAFMSTVAPLETWSKATAPHAPSGSVHVQLVNLLFLMVTVLGSCTYTADPGLFWRKLLNVMSCSVISVASVDPSRLSGPVVRMADAGPASGASCMSKPVRLMLRPLATTRAASMLPLAAGATVTMGLVPVAALMLTLPLTTSGCVRVVLPERTTLGDGLATAASRADCRSV
eukprot:comp22116_c0_seq1/m.32327 comp22116_c0_seq1/g.32327  ORF comp22116_c0_seq1/g.32327 comp22116_c0_seq1/m.32327 type:complete len:381 (+) comp22116_c0_seq1:448-1590(+)